MSQTRPCVGRQSQTRVVKLIQARLIAEPDSRARLVRVWGTLDSETTEIGRNNLLKKISGLIIYFQDYEKILFGCQCLYSNKTLSSLCEFK